MASNLKGKGGFTGVNTVVVAYDKSVHTNAKTGSITQWLDVQVDARDPRAKDDTNLHLYSARQQVDGQTRYNNGAAYTQKQFEAIKQAAGTNTVPVMDKDGSKQIGTLYAVKADVIKAANGNGLIINTRADKDGQVHVGPSQFQAGPDTLTNQFEAMRSAKATASRQATTEQQATAEQQVIAEQQATASAQEQQVEQTAEREMEPQF